MAENEQGSKQNEHAESSGSGRALTHRVLLQYAIGAVFLLFIVLLWLASSVLLLVFSAILVAVLLCSASAKLEQWFHIRHGFALAIVLLLGLTVIGGGAWMLAPLVSEQAGQLVTSLSAALERLRDFLARSPLFESVMEGLPEMGEVASSMPAVLTRAGTVFTGVFGMLANFVIVLFVSIYLAAQPQVYVNGIVTLFPKRRRDRIREVLYRIGDMLGLWLIGKMLAMLIVGTITAVGLTLLNVPLALLLGVVAGLFEFIPYLGPILAGIPAVLIAFSQSPALALYVLLLFGAIQIVEGYLLQPMIERRTVSLPPAMTISMQVLMALPFGLFGVALATPLTASIVVLITMLYVQDVLGDPVKPPGGD